MAEKQQQKDYEQDIEWVPVQNMTREALEQELEDQRQNYGVLEVNLFKQQTQVRKLEAQVKQLSEANQALKVNTNNTSSAFTLPSEFKKLWDELVSDHILDSFPDFLETPQLFVAFIQQTFIQVREDLILRTKHDMIQAVANTLNLSESIDGQQVLQSLGKKLQTVFQDGSQKIFEYSEDQLKQFISNSFKPKCIEALQQQADMDPDQIEMFIDNVESADFLRFLRAIVKLELHMVLNDPPIEMHLMPVNERLGENKGFLDKFEFWMYNKTDYYCIDGFPKEGNPCVVVLPPPFRQGYVYQGIKPAVIVIQEKEFIPTEGVDFEQLSSHVENKQEELLDKIKAKRAHSLADCTNTNEGQKLTAAYESNAPTPTVLNITQVKPEQEGPPSPVNVHKTPVSTRTKSDQKCSVPGSQKSIRHSQHSVQASPLITQNTPPPNEGAINIVDSTLKSENSLTKLHTSGDTVANKLAANQALISNQQYKRPNSRSNSAQREPVPGLQVLQSISNNSQASIIAEMHYQRGMNDIRQDLQRKICSYQSILKKTHLAAEKRKADKMGALEASLITFPDDEQESVDQDKDKVSVVVSKSSAPPPRFFNEPKPVPKRTKGTHETGCRPINKAIQKPGPARQSNIDTLQNLKSAYFTKMQSLNKKLEEDRTTHRKQLETKRTISRSKSPMQQPNRNMPRQISSSRGNKLSQSNSVTNNNKTKPKLNQSTKTKQPKTTTIQQKRKYNPHANQQRKLSQALSHSDKSSNFDESDTDDAEQILAKGSLGAFTRALEGTTSSIDDGTAYEPIHKLSSAINSTKRLAQQHVLVGESSCSDDDEDDLLHKRPLISQTFYQPSDQRRRTQASGQDSSRTQLGSVYQPPKQLQTQLHNRDLVSNYSAGSNSASLHGHPKHHSLRYSPNAGIGALKAQQSSHQRILSPKQMNNVARRSRDAAIQHAKRVSSGSRQPHKAQSSVSSNSGGGAGGGGGSHQLIQNMSNTINNQSRQSSKQGGRVSKDNEKASSLRQSNLYQNQNLNHSNSHQFYQPPNYQAPPVHQGYYHPVQHIRKDPSPPRPILQNSQSSKGILVNNFF